MREIVFDTETTGLEPLNGDRIVEVGCVELINYLPTGREFQIYINPGRPVSEATIRITGITNEMLKDAPRFEHESVVERLLEFIGDSPVVAHNAEFDRGFLNAELALLGKAAFPKERFIDTLVLARQHRPGSPASLDAVCKRFNISIEGRELHGALKDAKLLAMAYLELRGGRERRLDLSVMERAGETTIVRHVVRAQRPRPLPPLITAEEEAAHAAFVETIKAPLWKAG